MHNFLHLSLIALAFDTLIVCYCTRLHIYHKASTCRCEIVSWYPAHQWEQRWDSWWPIQPLQNGAAHLKKVKQSVFTALGKEHTQGTDHSSGDALQFTERSVNLKFFKFYNFLSFTANFHWIIKPDSKKIWRNGQPSAAVLLPTAQPKALRVQ